jgi:TPP-dependent trihydroxycyclohexane-1,2-dione (THcHDO) dehydratase
MGRVSGRCRPGDEVVMAAGSIQGDTFHLKDLFGQATYHIDYGCGSFQGKAVDQAPSW